MILTLLFLSTQIKNINISTERINNRYQLSIRVIKQLTHILIKKNFFLLYLKVFGNILFYNIILDDRLNVYI